MDLPNHLCLNCGKCNGKVFNNIWDEIPDGCGYEGWFFLEKEKEKQRLRKLNEKLLDLKIDLLNAKSNTKYKNISREISKIEEELKNNRPT